MAEALLASSCLPSVNSMALRAAAIKAWKAIKVGDGPNGSPKPRSGQPDWRLLDVGPNSTRFTSEGRLRPSLVNVVKTVNV